MSAMQLTQMSLETVGGGAIPELFDHEVNRILCNIADVNTPAESKRKLTIEIAFSPTEDRKGANIEIVAKSALVGPRPTKTSVFLGHADGRQVAYLRDPNQSEMDLRPPMEAVEGGKSDAE